MSHVTLRKDCNCLNCGSHVEQEYCSKCGQQNREPYESAWGVFTHFVADILHWDGKFWRTISGLFCKPGLLSKAYIEGKRASYVLPIRLYLICSLIFGICLSYTLKKFQNNSASSNITFTDKLDSISKANEFKAYQNLTPEEKKNADLEKLAAEANQKISDSIQSLALSFPLLDSFGDFVEPSIGWYNDKIIVPNGVTPNNIDSVIKVRKQLKGKSYGVSNYIENLVLRYFTQQKEKYKGSVPKYDKAIAEEIAKTLPKSFFVLMPLFGLVLWFMYRRQKLFMYHHIVFTIHYYCISFIVYSITLLLRANFPGLKIIGSLSIIGMLIYLFVAMKRFYGQSPLKTSIKFILLTFITILLLLLTFIIIVILGLANA